MRAHLHDIGPAVLLLLSGIGTGGALAQMSTPTVDVLTNVAQIRRMTAAQAAQSVPVHLTGVVVSEADPREHALILADKTAAIYLLAETNLFAPFHRRDSLEIEGVTDPGQFAPIVKVSAVRRRGSAAIPAPHLVSYPDLISGAQDGQWVEIAGVVHRYLGPETNSNAGRAYIAVPGGILSVRCPVPQDPLVQVDAEVRLQAVCLYQFNKKRQVLTPVLALPAGTKIRVEKPAPETPFDTPVRPADSLLQFDPDNPSGHRVHVRGVVTHSQSGSVVWIRDADSGLRIQVSQEANLKPGDEIDVLGFPSYGSPSPLLEDAIFRKIGTSQLPPTPLFLNITTNAFDHEDDLVAMDAMLTEVQPVLEGTALTLNADGIVFKAILKSSPDNNGEPDWLPGSKVRVAGICSVIQNDVSPVMGIWQPQAFQILMRSPADLNILSRPPWWTPRHIIYSLGVATGGLLLITGVVMFIARRRLNEQKRHRAMAEAEFAAILSERNRLAREIHDTLAQGLVATSVQLRLAKKQADGASELLHENLDTAQQLVRSSLEEARNSIWNMRSQVLETGDLAGALKSILKQMTSGSEMETRFEVTGRPRRLAPNIESNLLHFGQEAITNATKHAAARRIMVKLEFDEKQFRLLVTDDGRGFDPAGPPPSDGGFGLIGMHERAAELKGKLNIRSTPGQGAEIGLTIPLSGE